jgi:hypothetical protein
MSQSDRVIPRAISGMGIINALSLSCQEVLSVTECGEESRINDTELTSLVSFCELYTGTS